MDKYQSDTFLGYGGPSWCGPYPSRCHVMKRVCGCAGPGRYTHPHYLTIFLCLPRHRLHLLFTATNYPPHHHGHFLCHHQHLHLLQWVPTEPLPHPHPTLTPITSTSRSSSTTSSPPHHGPTPWKVPVSWKMSQGMLSSIASSIVYGKRESETRTSGRSSWRRVTRGEGDQVRVFEILDNEVAEVDGKGATLSEEGGVVGDVLFDGPEDAPSVGLGGATTEELNAVEPDVEDAVELAATTGCGPL